MLIQIKGEIPIEIQKLTGITEQELQSMGRPLEEVLEKLFEFVGNRIIATLMERVAPCDAFYGEPASLA